jgi:hypothetical protein
MSLKQRLKSFLQGRQIAYQQTFVADSPASERVLKDLAKFCRAYKTTFHADPRIQAVLEGRREVWLRIMHHLKLNPDEFWERYGRDDLE